jgi:hypothetical protein
VHAYFSAEKLLRSARQPAQGTRKQNGSLQGGEVVTVHFVGYFDMISL